MLNSFHLEDLLVAGGWTLVPDYNLTHAHGYRHPEATHPVYVKANTKHPDRSKPVEENPLLLHPDLRAVLGRSSIPGVSVDPENRFNDNAAAFPKCVNPNKRAGSKHPDKETHFGVAVGVSDSVALAALLRVVKV